MYADETNGTIRAIGIDQDLKLIRIEFGTNKVDVIGGLEPILTNAAQGTKVRKYDKLINWANYHPQLQLLTVSLVGSGVHLFRLK